MNSKNKGDCGETRVLYELTKRGLQVSLPFSDNAPYDLIVEVNNKLYKIQIKYTTHLSKNNSISAPCQSKNLGIKDMKAYTKSKSYFGLVDFLFVYLEPWDIVVVVDFKNLEKKKAVIFRNSPCKNKQKSNCRFVEDYTIDKWLASLN